MRVVNLEGKGRYIRVCVNPQQPGVMMNGQKAGTYSPLRTFNTNWAIIVGEHKAKTQ